MYKQIDELINSDKYKTLDLYQKFNKIYTHRYDNRYDGCVSAFIPDDEQGFVCSFDNNKFELGLISYAIAFDDYYNWDEELEARETTFQNDFIHAETMKLFLEFELDLLNILSESKPKLCEDVKVLKQDFDPDSYADAQYKVIYKNQALMFYYSSEYKGKVTWYASLLACADIEWGGWETFPTLSESDMEDTDEDWDDDDDWYDDDDYDNSEACLKDYKDLDLDIAKNIVFTLLDIINKLN